MTGVKYLKCIHSEAVYLEHPLYTVGKVYPFDENYSELTDDSSNDWCIEEASGSTWQYAGDPDAGLFVECDEHGNEIPFGSDPEHGIVRFTTSEERQEYYGQMPDESYISTPEEEEAFRKLEQNIEQEEISCNMAIAMNIQRLQKFLQETGVDTELVIHKDFVAITDNNCKEYRPSEGGVGTLIEYLRACGEVRKIKRKLERR